MNKLFGQLTQHERIVLSRAQQQGLSVKEYARKWGSKNLPHLLSAEINKTNV